MRPLSLAVVLAVILVGGCTNVRPCRQGTLLVAVSWIDSAEHDVDQIQVSVLVGGKHTSTSRTVSSAEGKLEIDFSGYPAGEEVDVAVLASLNGAPVGLGTAVVNDLPAGCGHTTLLLSPVLAGTDLSVFGGQDLASQDLTGADLISVNPPDLNSADLFGHCAAGNVFCPANGDRCTPTAYNDAQCGNALTACAPGTLCYNDSCQPSASPFAVATPAQATGGIVGLALDSTYVYFSDGGTPGNIYRCPLDGCPAGGATLFASAQGAPRTIAIDSTRLYWADNMGGNIGSLALNNPGGTPTMLAVGQGAPYFVTVDAVNAYWVSKDNSQVRSCPLATGCVSPMPSPADLTHGTGTGAGESIATDGVNVYWLTSTSNEVYQCPVGGCGAAPVLLANGIAPAHITVDGKFVYFTDGGNGGSLNRCAIGGCALQPDVLATPLAAANGIWVDAVAVYVTLNKANGGIVKVGLCAGGQETLASGQGSPIRITGDALNVYYTNGGADPIAVGRVPR